jgi:hypothetical protein
MQKRPVPVSVIAWILILTGGNPPIPISYRLNDPMALEIMKMNVLPIPAQYAICLFGLLIMIVSGIGMLRARNWARFLFILWSVVAFFIGIATIPLKTAAIPGFSVCLIAAFFLFLPKANEYFKPVKSSSEARGI